MDFFNRELTHRNSNDGIGACHTTGYHGKKPRQANDLASCSLSKNIEILIGLWQSQILIDSPGRLAEPGSIQHQDSKVLCQLLGFQLPKTPSNPWWRIKFPISDVSFPRHQHLPTRTYDYNNYTGPCCHVQVVAPPSTTVLGPKWIQWIQWIQKFGIIPMLYPSSLATTTPFWRGTGRSM